MIILSPHTRGTAFSYQFELAQGTFAFFATLTFRVFSAPPETEEDVSDLLGSVELTEDDFDEDGKFGTVTIPNTDAWPLGRVYWYLEGGAAATGLYSSIASGIVEVLP
jgi:hypothetical protein